MCSAARQNQMYDEQEQTNAHCVLPQLKHSLVRHHALLVEVVRRALKRGKNSTTMANESAGRKREPPNPTGSLLSKLANPAAKVLLFWASSLQRPSIRLKARLRHVCSGPPLLALAGTMLRKNCARACASPPERASVAAAFLCSIFFKGAGWREVGHNVTFWRCLVLKYGKLNNLVLVSTLFCCWRLRRI